jgi:hypothetical protein
MVVVGDHHAAVKQAGRGTILQLSQLLEFHQLIT